MVKAALKRDWRRSGRISYHLLTRAVNESGMFTTKPELLHMSLTTKCFRDDSVKWPGERWAYWAIESKTIVGNKTCNITLYVRKY